MTPMPSKLELHGENGFADRAHPYLFRASSQNEIFLEVETEMAKLNDFCFLIENAVTHYSYQPRLDVDLTGIDPDDPDNEDLIDESWWLESVGFGPDEVGVLYGPATSLILLYFLTTQALKKLNSSYNKSRYQTFVRERRKTRDAEIVWLIKLLEFRMKTCFSVLEDPEIESVLIKKVRWIRNDFAHGNWDRVEQNLSGIGVIRAFSLAARMFSKIEFCINDEFLANYSLSLGRPGVSGPSYFDEERQEKVIFPEGTKLIFDEQRLKWVPR